MAAPEPCATGGRRQKTTPVVATTASHSRRENKARHVPLAGNRFSVFEKPRSCRKFRGMRARYSYVTISHPGAIVFHDSTITPARPPTERRGAGAPYFLSAPLRFTRRRRLRPRRCFRRKG